MPQNGFKQKTINLSREDHNQRKLQQNSIKTKIS